MSIEVKLRLVGVMAVSLLGCGGRVEVHQGRDPEAPTEVPPEVPAECPASCGDAIAISPPEGFVSTHACLEGQCRAVSRTVVYSKLDTVPSGAPALAAKVWLHTLEPPAAALPQTNLVRDTHCTLVVAPETPFFEPFDTGEAVATVEGPTYAVSLDAAQWVASDLEPPELGDSLSFELTTPHGDLTTTLAVPGLDDLHADPLTQGEPWRIAWTPIGTVDVVRITHRDNHDDDNGKGKRLLECQVPGALGEVVVSSELTAHFVDTTSTKAHIDISANRVEEVGPADQAAMIGVRISNVYRVSTEYVH